MKKNDSWLNSTSNSSYYRGSRRGGSTRSLARFSRLISVVVILAILISIVQLLRPVPSPRASQSLSDSVIPGQRPSLPWPQRGGAEVAIQNVGVIGSFNPNLKIQLASVAKIITALVIVKDHPLTLGSSGPSVTITPKDVANYRYMVSQQDSVMGVTVGETLSEYQMLEALLIPSADNIAVKLAQWDSGSTAAFVAKMNAYAKSLGMNNTAFKDPAGLSSGTMGTASDQVIAGLKLLQNPVLSQIVAKPQATFPVVGVQFNVNYNVGHDGFVGIKTGSIGTAANLVFAATGSSGSSDLIVGAVMGQQGAQPLASVLNASRKLVDAARKIPRQEQVLRKGQLVGAIEAPGNKPIPVFAAQGASFLGWPGLKVNYKVSFIKLPRNISAGAKVGTLTVSVGAQSHTVEIISGSAVKAPSLAWRLERF